MAYILRIKEQIKVNKNNPKTIEKQLKNTYKRGYLSDSCESDYESSSSLNLKIINFIPE